MDRNLAMEVVRVTEIAAIAAARLMGRGQKNEADQASVDAMGRAIDDLTVIILDRDRHQGLIKEVRSTGARIRLIDDGDVAAGIATCFEETGVDVLMGSGGAPEGVITAAAVRSVGGDMQGQL